MVGSSADFMIDFIASWTGIQANIRYEYSDEILVKSRN